MPYKLRAGHDTNSQQTFSSREKRHWNQVGHSSLTDAKRAKGKLKSSLHKLSLTGLWLFMTWACSSRRLLLTGEISPSALMQYVSRWWWCIAAVGGKQVLAGLAIKTCGSFGESQKREVSWLMTGKRCERGELPAACLLPNSVLYICLMYLYPSVYHIQGNPTNSRLKFN